MINISRLNELGNKYPSDKKTHGYYPHYASNLPERCRMLLEIGVATGLSLEIWNELYGPDEVDIHCLDLFKNTDFVGTRWCRNRGFFPIQGDQSSMETLSSMKSVYEIIIDDASHNCHHQLISFKHLFLNNLTPGGLYVIEDMHTSSDPFYYGGFVHNFSDTPLAMFKHFCNAGGEIKNDFFNAGEREVFHSLIDSVKVYDDKIAFITRKK